MGPTLIDIFCLKNVSPSKATLAMLCSAQHLRAESHDGQNAFHILTDASAICYFKLHTYDWNSRHQHSPLDQETDRGTGNS